MSRAYVPGDGTLKGRGAGANPPNRFERLRYEADEEGLSGEADPRPVPTQFFRDVSRTVLARNDSPDIPFEVSLNPYRGCEHGCAYCYARPTHEYLGFSAGLDFETRILVKEDAPELLRRELLSPRWKPQAVTLSGVTDPYQPVERRLRLTRRCLEVFAEFLNPVGVVTKNELVTRDADLLWELARHGASAVAISISTLRNSLSSVLEPRASTPARRLEAIRSLSSAHVPCGVYVAPVIPGLNDHEIPAIVAAAREAGATYAGFTPLRLPYAVAPIFLDWLERHVPLKKDKIVGRIRSFRGGRLNDPRFGSRFTGEGPWADQIDRLFEVAARKAGLPGPPRLSAKAFRMPAGPQLSLFPEGPGARIPLP